MDIATNGYNRLLDPDTGQPIEGDDGFLLPTHRTFASVWNSISKTFPFTFDEAMRHSKTNALAMVRDVFLMGCLHERIMQLAELPWHLEPENQKNSKQVEEAKELENICKSTNRWIQFATQLGWATWYGRYANELLWKAKKVNGKNALCVARHIPINGDKIQFGWDGVPRVQVGYEWINHNGPKDPSARDEWLRTKIDNYDPKIASEYDISGARINSDDANPIIYGDRAPMLVLSDPLWRERFVIHKHMCIDADYFDAEMSGGVHGVGIRSMIYWFFWVRGEMIGWAINHMKKIGVGGILIFYYEEGNPAAKTAAENAAKDAGERYALAMPRPRGSTKDVTHAELLPFNEAGVTALKDIVETYYERHIERLIVGQSLSSKAEATGLGSSVAEFHEETKFKILKFDALNLQDTLTEDYVMVHRKWNQPRLEYPVKFVFDIPDPGAEAKIQGASALFQMGMKLKAQPLRGLAGQEKPDDDDETVSQADLAKQQQEVQSQAQQQQMQAQGQQQQQQGQQQHQMEMEKTKQDQEFQSKQAEDAHRRELEMTQAQNMQEQRQQQQDVIQEANNEALANGEPPLTPAEQQLLQMQEEVEPVKYAATHAPKGGITIRGKKFVGGQFIPASVMAKATPQEKRKLQQKQQSEKAPKPAKTKPTSSRPGQPPPDRTGEMPVQVPVQPTGDHQVQPPEPSEPHAEGPATAAEMTTRDQLVPDEQIPDMLNFAMTSQLNPDMSPENKELVSKWIVSFGQMTTREFASKAGTAYNVAARPAATMEEAAASLAARIVSRYRFGGEKSRAREMGIPPISRAVEKGAKEAGKAAASISKPAITDLLESTTAPKWRQHFGAGKVSQKTHEATVKVASGITSRLIGASIAKLPVFIRWLNSYESDETPVTYDAEVEALTDLVMYELEKE